MNRILCLLTSFAVVIVFSFGCASDGNKTQDASSEQISENTEAETTANETATPPGENDWTQFRGTNRNGKSNETGLLKQFPAEGPEKVWQVETGSAYTGIIISAGNLFTAWDEGDSQYLFCMDAITGKEKWRYRLDSNYVGGWGDGPLATPAVDESAVYMVSTKGVLHAVDVIQGSELWSKDLKTDFGYIVPFYGFAVSPIIDDERVYIQAGGKDDYTFLAFDKKTGELAWHSLTDLAAYSSPVDITVDGVRQIIFETATRLFSVNPDDGSLYWEFYWEANCSSAGPMNTVSPTFIPPDKIFISGGFGSVTGGSMVQMTKSGEGIDIEEIWYNQEINNVFNPSLFLDGYIYGFHEKMLRCIDASNGEMKWEMKGFGRGSLIAADGMLIVLGENGELALVEVSPEEYKELANIQIFEGRSWTAPTIANGNLYLRNQKEMICLDFKAK